VLRCVCVQARRRGKSARPSRRRRRTWLARFVLFGSGFSALCFGLPSARNPAVWDYYRTSLLPRLRLLSALLDAACGMLLATAREDTRFGAQ
jgi:hypothetical protein